MDITPYVDSLRRDLVAAAETGSTEVRAAADRLALVLDPAARLALMEALSHAAAEITTELPSGSVDVRLNGRELDFVVTQPPPSPTEPAVAPTTTRADEPEDDGTLARITLRIPDSVKSRAEELAAKGGQSLNTWLVSVVRRATAETAIDVDLDLTSLPFLPDGLARRGQGSSRRLTGWV